ncbi:MAG: hypothetical protein HKM93_04530 [Desulfobacteraceae bacterium]|nr:hypothetical protein [Desulfobacteraceae bacterium]
MKKLPLIMLSICFIIHPLTGCQNAEIEKIRSEHEQTKEINRRLRANLDDLKSEVKNSKARLDDMSGWSGQLVNHLGPCVWYFSEFEKPLPHEIMENANPQQLVEKLNILFKSSGSPEVILGEIENGIAQVRVSDETQLTQRMGTAGATAYINAVTYTLVSVTSINCVDFQFTVGDHAIPGKYCP